jgi:filamin
MSYYGNNSGGGGGPGYMDPYGNLGVASPTAAGGQQIVPNPHYQQYFDYDDQEQPEYDRTEEEIDEEMQRELAEDAPWKKIQQNTFTRWANEHLKLVNRRIEDLQWDLGDGLNLIALVEVLSHKKLPRYNKKPMFRSQKLENISVALDFLENVEHIKLVNIGDYLNIFLSVIRFAKYEMRRIVSKEKNFFTTVFSVVHNLEKPSWLRKNFFFYLGGVFLIKNVDFYFINFLGILPKRGSLDFSS